MVYAVEVDRHVSYPKELGEEVSQASEVCGLLLQRGDFLFLLWRSSFYLLIYLFV